MIFYFWNGNSLHSDQALADENNKRSSTGQKKMVATGNALRN
jgi:hypothetical protein